MKQFSADTIKNWLDESLITQNEYNYFSQQLNRELNAMNDTAKISETDKYGNINEWYLKKIDSTHFKSANNLDALKDGRGMVFHIAQIRNKVYYDDVREWLHNKKDINDNIYEYSF